MRLWNALDAYLYNQYGMRILQGFKGQEHFTVWHEKSRKTIRTFKVGKNEYWLDTLIRIADWMSRSL